MQNGTDALHVLLALPFVSILEAQVAHGGTVSRHCRILHQVVPHPPSLPPLPNLGTFFGAVRCQTGHVEWRPCGEAVYMLQMRLSRRSCEAVWSSFHQMQNLLLLLLSCINYRWSQLLLPFSCASACCRHPWD